MREKFIGFDLIFSRYNIMRFGYVGYVDIVDFGLILSRTSMGSLFGKEV